MAIRIVTTKLGKIKKKDIPTLKKLTMGHEGLMADYLEGYPNFGEGDPKDFPIAFAFDTRKKRIVGWTILNPMYGMNVPDPEIDPEKLSDKELESDKPYVKKSDYIASIFIAPKYRRKGIGKDLLKKLSKKVGAKRLFVLPGESKKGSMTFYTNVAGGKIKYPKRDDFGGFHELRGFDYAVIHPDTMKKIAVKKAKKKPTKKKTTKSIFTKRIKNPKTGRQILVKTALSYDKKHPAYKAAKKLINK